MHQRARHDPGQLLTAAKPVVTAFPGAIWLAHRLVRKPNGELDKPPVAGFRTNDPATWCSLPGAVEAGGDGVGFAIVAGMIALDFDNCVRSDGKVAPEILTLVDALDSLSYVTVSGRGLRVICRNDATDPFPPGKHTVRTPGGHKVEVFVGPCHFYNTFSPETDGKPVRPVARQVIDRLLNGTESHRRTPNNDNNRGDFGRTSELGKKAKNIDALLAALTMIPHDERIDRNLWVKIGLGVYSGTGGADRGRDAFLDWSATWHRHDEDPDGHLAAAETLWDSFANSPPTAIGAGTIFELAKQYGWTWPKPKPKLKPTTTGGRLTVKTFLDAQLQPMRDFVEELLETDSIAEFHGAPGCGKTFLVLDLLMHIAWGRTWFGLDVDQGPTLLFALESRYGVERRILTFRRHHRLEGVALPFRYVTDPIDLTSDASIDEVIRVIRQEQQALGRKIKVVAIDTLAAALGRGDENTAETMLPVLARCHRIRLATGCCVILVGHPGKDRHRGLRGFSGTLGAVSTSIEIEAVKNSNVRRIIVRKQRDLDWHADLFYRLKAIELGVNKRGRMDTSCVVVPLIDGLEREAAERAAKLARLTRQHRLALDVLRETLKQHGLRPVDGKPAARVTGISAWLKAFQQQLPAGTTAETARRALQRARQVLLEADLIGAGGKQVWVKGE